MRSKASVGRWLALVAVLALVAAACDGGGAATTVAGTEPPVATTAAPTPAETTQPPVAGFTYTMGMTSDIITPNFWALIGPDGTVYMDYVFGPTKPSLFGIAYPGVVVAPSVAAGLPAEAVEEAGAWTITQEMRSDFLWSDGTPVTADDVAFTFATARDTTLGGDWLSSYPYSEDSSPRLVNVEAVSPTTVKFTFDSKPGLAVWPHNVGTAPIMPKHIWEPIVQEALGSEDPAAVLYGSDAAAIGDVTGGAVNFSSWEPGAFVENVANFDYSDSGLTHTFYEDGTYAQGDTLYYGEGTGAVSTTFTEGPYLENAIFSIYGDQAAAMLALTSGEIDYWINPLGVSPGLRQQGLAAENLAVAVNPTNGFRYLAFNLRKSPGKFPEFRQAVALMIDKELLTQQVLQGVAFPLYALIPEGNQKWYNEEVATEIESQYVGKSTEDRLNEAIALLEGAGWTWDTKPTFVDAAVVPGVGLTDPEGNKVSVEIMAPAASYDPLRATASLWIEDWMGQLGVDARANPTDFNTIVNKVWPGVGEEIPFDTYILGWSLGNAAFPTFHESFFHSRNFAEVNDGSNSTGYSDPEFDALADAMFATTDEAEAYDLIWQMEQKLAADLPYVVLFDTPITEFYSTAVNYPFTSTLSGLQFLRGFQGDVAK